MRPHTEDILKLGRLPPRSPAKPHSLAQDICIDATRHQGSTLIACRLCLPKLKLTDLKYAHSVSDRC